MKNKKEQGETPQTFEREERIIEKRQNEEKLHHLLFELEEVCARFSFFNETFRLLEIGYSESTGNYKYAMLLPGEIINKTANELSKISSDLLQAYKVITEMAVHNNA